VKVLETDNWSLLLPAEWIAERDGDAVLICDRDGVGCLEISELRRGAAGAAGPVIAELAGDVPGGLRDCRIAGIAGSHASFEEDGAAIREWYLAVGPLLLFITYSCELSQRGMDDAAVDDILSTLRIADGAPS